MTPQVQPSVDQVHRFVANRYGSMGDVTVLQGGAWSSAYSFRTLERALVLRIGDHREDFEKEAIAATWNEPGLPVPEVLDLGDAFDRHYIVSQHHDGAKLADLDPSRVRGAVEHLLDVLVSMRRVRLPGDGFGIWCAPDCSAPAPSWSEYLCAIADRDEERLVDWRRKLSLVPRAHAAFGEGCARLLAGAVDLPATRGLVHADVLLNHLVADDDTITAVFDWGNALAGDPLYDIAWIVFCIPWFPAIDRDHVVALARRHFPDDDIERLLPLYELHIAIGSLQYLAFRGDRPELDAATDRLAQLLSTMERA